jgi:hypothetical protein
MSLPAFTLRRIIIKQAAAQAHLQGHVSRSVQVLLTGLRSVLVVGLLLGGSPCLCMSYRSWHGAMLVGQTSQALGPTHVITALDLFVTHAVHLSCVRR